MNTGKKMHPKSLENLKKGKQFSEEYQPANRKSGKHTKTILKEIFSAELPANILNEPWLKAIMGGDKNLEKGLLATAAFHALKGSHKHLETLYKISGHIGQGKRGGEAEGLDKPIGNWTKEDYQKAFRIMGDKEAIERQEAAEIEDAEEIPYDEEEELARITAEQNKILGI